MKISLKSSQKWMKWSRRSLSFILLCSTLAGASSLAFAEGSDELYDRDSHNSINTGEQYYQRLAWYNETDGVKSMWVNVPKGMGTVNLKVTYTLLNNTTSFDVPDGVQLKDDTNKKINPISSPSSPNYAGEHSYVFSVEGGKKYHIFIPLKSKARNRILYKIDVTIDGKTSGGYVYSDFWAFDATDERASYGSTNAWDGTLYGLIDSNVVAFKMDQVKGVNYGIAATTGGGGTSYKWDSGNPGTVSVFDAISNRYSNKIPLYINPPAGVNPSDTRTARKPTFSSVTSNDSSSCDSSSYVAPGKTVTFNVTTSATTGKIRLDCTNATGSAVFTKTIDNTSGAGTIFWTTPSIGDYTCKATSYLGQVNLNFNDAETMGGLRMYDYYSSSNTVPLYMTWDDTSVDNYSTFTTGVSNYASAFTSPEGGLLSGPLNATSSPYASGNRSGNARAWGSYSTAQGSGAGNIGHYNIMVTSALYGASEPSDGKVIHVVTDSAHACPAVPTIPKDTDRDGIPDSVECVDATHTSMDCDNVDTDGDGIPDYKDLDSDNDGILDKDEAYDYNRDGQSDISLPSGAVSGSKLDSKLTTKSNCTGNFVGGMCQTADSDHDGVPNFRDSDSDNDGITDFVEAYDKNHDGKVTNSDVGITTGQPSKVINPDSIKNVDGGDATNGLNAVAKKVKATPIKPDDADGDHIPNFLDRDSDDDGIDDFIEVYDKNHDGKVTEREDGFKSSASANTPVDPATITKNGGKGVKSGMNTVIRDALARTSPTPVALDDADGDGVPNYLDVDSDNDGLKDVDEAYAKKDGSGAKASTSNDGNHNGIDDHFDRECVKGNPNNAKCKKTLPSLSSLPTLANNNSPTSSAPAKNAIPDYLDPDSDGDKVTDHDEVFGKDTTKAPAIPTSGMRDQNHNGLDDHYDADCTGTCTRPTPKVDNSSSKFPKKGGNLTYLDPTVATTPNTPAPKIDDKDGIDKSVECNSKYAPANCDSDGDGVPNDEDADSDNDGIPDIVECDAAVSGKCRDTDGDGVPDFLDSDSDNDGIPDFIEAYDKNHDGKVTAGELGIGPDITKAIDPHSADKDGLNEAAKAALKPSGGPTPISSNDNDHIPDYRDMDSDGDGIPDKIECPKFDTARKCVNTDGDAEPDYLDTDSDSDGIPDIAEGVMDKNGVAVTPSGADNNQNGIDDAFDIACLSDSKCKSSVKAVKDTNGGPKLFETKPGTKDYLDKMINPTCDSVGNCGAPSNLKDFDNDGLPDSFECQGFMTYHACEKGDKDIDGDHIPPYRDFDSDNDGLLDGDECLFKSGACTADSKKLNRFKPDTDGNGIKDGGEDYDGDGIPNKVECGSVSSTHTRCIDSDNDGIPNLAEWDSDKDGLPDADECLYKATQGCTNKYSDPTDPNDAHKDADNDGTDNLAECGLTVPATAPNRCNDANNDHIPDYIEGANDNGPSGDPDGDKIDNSAECVDATHSSMACDQVDSDGDNTPDNKDLDSDNDGIPDIVECNAAANGGNCVDTDNDGIPDYRDLDSDDDGIPDSVEAYDKNGDGVVDDKDIPGWMAGENEKARVNGINPEAKKMLDKAMENGAGADVVRKSYLAEFVADSDGDKVPDFLDKDSDNDGILDKDEAYDKNEDGVVDNNDISGYASAKKTMGLNNAVKKAIDGGLKPVDTDGDGVPNYRDLDSDGDNISDRDEAWGDDSTGRLPANIDPNKVDKDGIPTDIAKRAKNAPFNGHPKNSDKSATDPAKRDNIPDFLDPDSDGDGALDKDEAYRPKHPAGADNNHNGLDDAYDPSCLHNSECANGGINEVPGLNKTGSASTPDVINPGTDGYNPDGDEDGDGILNKYECVDAAHKSATRFSDCEKVDTDNDGVPDYRDLDSDNDGILDAIECRKDANGECQNTDKLYKDGGAPVTADELPDYRDKDSDGDGITDKDEAGFGKVTLNKDAKKHGGIDSAYLNPDGTPKIKTASELPNTDKDLAKDLKNKVTADDLPDVIDVDSDGDNIPDSKEGFVNNNGVPVPLSGTANKDGVDNDVAGKTPSDTDGDGVPNYLDPDSDGDNVPDSVEAYGPGTIGTTDSNPKDGLADEVENGSGKELANSNKPGTTGAKTTNNVPDFLDKDDDGDGVPTKNEDANNDGDPTNDTTKDANGNKVPNYLNPSVSISSASSDGFGIVAGGCSSVPGETPSALPILGLLAGLIGWIRRRFTK